MAWVTSNYFVKDRKPLSSSLKETCFSWEGSSESSKNFMTVRNCNKEFVYIPLTHHIQNVEPEIERVIFTV